jgi:hypothetical protein
LKGSLLLDFDSKGLSDFEGDVLPDLERKDLRGLVIASRDVVQRFLRDLGESALFNTDPLPRFDLVSFSDLIARVLEDLAFAVLRGVEPDDLRALGISDLSFLDAAPLRDFWLAILLDLDAIPLRRFEAAPLPGFESEDLRDLALPVFREVDLSALRDLEPALLDAALLGDFWLGVLPDLDAAPLRAFEAAPLPGFEREDLRDLALPVLLEPDLTALRDLDEGELVFLDAEPLRDFEAAPFPDFEAEDLREFEPVDFREADLGVLRDLDEIELPFFFVTEPFRPFDLATLLDLEAGVLRCLDEVFFPVLDLVTLPDLDWRDFDLVTFWPFRLEVLTDLFALFLLDLVGAFRFLETALFPGFDDEFLRDLEALGFEDLAAEFLLDLVWDFLPCFAEAAFLFVLDFGFLRDLETVDLVDLDLVDLALLPLFEFETFDFEATDLPALPFEDFCALDAGVLPFLDAGAFPFLGVEILVDLDEEVLRDLVLALLRVAADFADLRVAADFPDLEAAPLRDLGTGPLPALAAPLAALLFAALRACDVDFAPEVFLRTWDVDFVPENFLAEEFLAADFGAAFRVADLPTNFAAAGRCADFFGETFAEATFLLTAFDAALAGAALRATAGAGTGFGFVAVIGFDAAFEAGLARFSKSRETIFWFSSLVRSAMAASALATRSLPSSMSLLAMSSDDCAYVELI